MNLHRMLAARAEDGRPIRVGLIGAGKFGSMFLAQARRTPGLHLLAVADLDVPVARRALAATGWPEESIRAVSFDAALESGGTFVGDDGRALIAADGMDLVIDATGDPAAGIRHVLACCQFGRHIIMVNVEADALAGPLLARRADAAGIVYSLAYGDQPALICEQVDWARASGFDVVAAGKGTLYMPHFHASTPETIWDHYGLDAERAEASGLNAKMFNSFLDGTKSAIEMAAVANATGLTPAPDGLAFPPCAVHDLASTLIPEADGGCLHHKGQVEVISSRDRDGRDIDGDLRWGVYVVFEAPSDYVERCFADYGLITDPSGRYTALWRPYHLIGLELGISVAYAGLMDQATGCATGFRADVAATAKRNLAAGEVLDGEGGATVWGRLMPAAASLEQGALPIGLAHGMALRNDVAEGTTLCWSDVAADGDDETVRLRREMETTMAPSVSDAP
ncbi:MAG: flagellar biosynthesis protein FlgA [Rhodospirillales bacterium]|jgi:predicted homoserine dehydrogenase-like protein|nr:flagellar biosynthesis protein FlgA [Rhodospirillales bacterium]